MIPVIPEGDLLPNVPQVVHEGKYRLYQKPDGGYHLVYKRDDKDTEDHMDLPGGMVALSQKMSEGNMSFPQFMKEAIALMSELRKM